MHIPEITRGLALLLICFSTSLLWAQSEFEPAYYVDTQGKRVDCLIEPLDWSSIPSKLLIKRNEGAGKENLSLSEVIEFGIGERIRYIKKTVNIDRSKKTLSNLSRDSKPIFQEETLFLKFITEGKASLYQYRDKGITLFFYQVDDKPLEQLLDIDYLDAEGNIKNDKRYIRQLFTNLKCESISQDSYERIKYARKSLQDLFSRYNECQDTAFRNYRDRKPEKFLFIYLKTGFQQNYSSIKSNAVAFKQAEFGPINNPRYALEAEFSLPSRKNAWSIPLEIAYHEYTSDTIMTFRNTQEARLYYSTIDVAPGIRRHFNVAEKIRLFAQARIYLHFPFKNSLVDYENSNDFTPDFTYSIGLGAGAKIGSRWLLEAFYMHDRDYLASYLNFKSTYRAYGLSLGFKLY